MPPKLPRLAFALCVVVFATGCATVRHPELTAEQLIEDGQVANAVHRSTVERIVTKLARRAERGDRTLDVLYLSGGGQNGAYGAGFLHGWRERADAPMPVFDLVTGVSTGSIQSPFAFVGTEAALDTIAALYEMEVRGAAPTLDGLFWLRKTGGLLEVDGLERTLRRTVDPKFAHAMADGFRDDRQLLVATTDFDLGTGRLWDLGEELAASPAGLERVREVILASSSIPGAFPSRILDRHVHLDGSVISNLAVPLDLAAFRALGKKLRAAGVAGPVTVRLWVIFNLWTHAETSVLNPASRGSITRRATMLLFTGQLPQLVTSLESLAHAVAAEVPELRLEVRHTAIPSELAEEPEAKALVDAVWMRRLHKLGYERAKSAAPWDVGVPGPYVRPDVRPHTEP